MQFPGIGPFNSNLSELSPNLAEIYVKLQRKEKDQKDWQEIEHFFFFFARSLAPEQQLELWLAIPSDQEGRLLLKYGLDVNVFASYGTPILHFVARFTDINGVLREPIFRESHRQTLKALLACGADPTISCWYLPECSLNTLQLNQHPEIREILNEHLNPIKG